MRWFNSISFRFTLFMIVVLMLIFSLQSAMQIRSNIASDKAALISSAESFAALSAKPIIDNYKLYYSSGFYKFREVTENVLELNEDIENMQILSVSGEILFDSEEFKSRKDAKDADTKNFCDETLLSRLKKPEQFSREISIDGKRSLEVLQPSVEDWGRYSSSVKYLFSFDSVAESTRKLILSSAIIGLCFFIATVIIISSLSRVLISKRISNLIRLMADYGKGVSDMEKKLSSAVSADEIGMLAHSFKDMVVQLESSKQTIEKHTKDLEGLVVVRTKELNRKLGTLEKLNKFMVGRELKMVGLKKRISELEREAARRKPERSGSKQDDKSDKAKSGDKNSGL